MGFGDDGALFNEHKLIELHSWTVQILDWLSWSILYSNNLIKKVLYVLQFKDWCTRMIIFVYKISISMANLWLKIYLYVSFFYFFTFNYYPRT